MEHQQAADIRAGEKPLEIVFGGDWVDTALRKGARDPMISDTQWISSQGTAA